MPNCSDVKRIACWMISVFYLDGVYMLQAAKLFWAASNQLIFMLPFIVISDYYGSLDQRHCMVNNGYS